MERPNGKVNKDNKEYLSKNNVSASITFVRGSQSSAVRMRAKMRAAEYSRNFRKFFFALWTVLQLSTFMSRFETRETTHLLNLHIIPSS